MKKLTHAFVVSEIEKIHPGSKVLNTYENSKSILDITCENNHSYKATWNKIQAGRWCITCWKDKCKTITTQDVKNYLLKNYPKAILLNEYKDFKTKMDITCENNHLYKTSYACLLRGNWCNKCKNLNRKPTNDQLIKLCNKSNAILKTKYDGETSVNFICKCGKSFNKEWIKINYNKPIMCETCYKDLYVITIDKVRERVKKYNGECLTNEYKNAMGTLYCKCQHGHIFKTCWNFINSGNWCPYCCKTKKLSLDIVKEYVKENYNGECLEDNYVNIKANMKFKCHKNHIWSATFDNIKRGKWCPICSSGFGENMSRYIISQMFGYEFIKTRDLNFLINEETGSHFELDGFCKELNMAFEYQGRYHKEVVKEYKMTEEDLEKRKRYDEIKRQKCKENNVLLIEIPQFNYKFKPKHLPGFIDNVMKINKVDIEYKIDIDIKGFYA